VPHVHPIEQVIEIRAGYEHGRAAVREGTQHKVEVARPVEVERYARRRLVWGAAFGVWGVGFGVWGLGFGVWGLGFGVWGLGFGVWGLGFGVWGLGPRLKGSGLRVWGLRCRTWVKVWDLGWEFLVRLEV
jgi:hypothetical protein